MMFCQMMFGLSFYGVLVSLTRFFLEDLNYNEADTMMIVGAFSAIGPLFAIAGGFIADKFLGAYRSLSIAFLAFASGYVLLVLAIVCYSPILCHFVLLIRISVHRHLFVQFMCDHCVGRHAAFGR